MASPEVRSTPALNRMIVFIITLLTFVPRCDAFFRNLMIGDTAMARIDPIVNRGGAAMHVHHLTGGGNLDFESTGETLSTSTCTNSLLKQDKSAYWAPWMYFQHDNGTFEPVQLALGLTAYYKYEVRGNTGGKVKYSVFPKGLKMLSGDTNKRTWKGPWPVPEESLWGPEDMTQEALQEKAMGFNCMNYEPGKNEPSFAYPWLRNKDFLDANCINGVRAEIIFPSCWDGVNLDSDDHKSHVKFPSLIQDGVCPDTHPVYLPILFYETIWQTNAFKGYPGQFVLSNGDPTGYGYHADFIAAWDDGIQEQVRDNALCTGLSTNGDINTCPVFQGNMQTQAEARACKLKVPDAVADEQTEGVLDGLPGGVKVIGLRHDPGTNSGVEESYAPSVSIPETRSAAQASKTDIVGTGYYNTEVTVPTPSPTTLAVSYGKPQAVDPHLRTSTYTSGRYVVEMVLVEMFETVTENAAPTMTQTVVIPRAENTSPSAKSRRRRHIRKHVHSHDRF